MKSLDEAIAVLEDLEAGDIADLMRSAGIKGRPNDPSFCPLAQWVAQETGGNASVGSLAVFVFGDEEEDETVWLPWGAQRFVARFDARHYPDLVVEES